MEVSISAYVYIIISVLYVYKRIFIYTYICTVLVVYGIHIIYIVFVRTLSITFTSALLLINSSAISVRPYLAECIRAVHPHYIYIYIYIYTNIRTKTYDIDIVKEVSIHNTSYTIINMQCVGSLFRY